MFAAGGNHDSTSCRRGPHHRSGGARAASNVSVGIVPKSGHWIMEENPEATTKLVTDFLGK
jgi:pimeloyl-ACP methyl ester carboxylesterase